jgi:hypothetical protein
MVQVAHWQCMTAKYERQGPGLQRDIAQLLTLRIPRGNDHPQLQRRALRQPETYFTDFIVIALRRGLMAIDVKRY